MARGSEDSASFFRQDPVLAGGPELAPATVFQRTAEGVLVIRAERLRTQDRNREEARERLAALVRAALVAPKRRIKTKPTAASRTRRLERKKRRGDVKRLRRASPHAD